MIVDNFLISIQNHSKKKKNKNTSVGERERERKIGEKSRIIIKKHNTHTQKIRGWGFFGFGDKKIVYQKEGKRAREKKNKHRENV